MDNSNLVKSLLDVHLGKGKIISKGDVAYYCPICKHKNAKLMVNVKTGNYNCFTCHPKTTGKTPVSLLKKIGSPSEAIIEMKGYFINDTTSIKAEEEIKLVHLPKEFINLIDTSDTCLEKRQAVTYLKKRGVSSIDIVKYNIGYCKTGRYRNKVIVPSYNSNGRLNYFIARSFEKEPKLKIDSPECKKSELIGFEYYINWNTPVILCEGIFDAMAIKRNAIPLFGKTISKALMIKLLQSDVQTVYLALDDDAIRESIDHAQKLLDLGKEVYIIKLEGKDPSELGFENMISCLQSAKPLTATDLLLLKMQTALC
jgi:DNA primase